MGKEEGGCEIYGATNTSLFESCRRRGAGAVGNCDSYKALTDYNGNAELTTL